ncbi:FxLYD domain-containing protein [Streptomyces sp. NPDC003635]
MRTGPPRPTRPPRKHSAATAVAGLLVAALGAVALVSCSDDDNGATATETPTSPKTVSFSGSVPSALDSLAESVKASLSAAASSAEARASEFEASVSAEVARANAAAQEELKDVDGQGNATADVSLTGKPRAETGGLRAVVVNITNSTDETASYAVQVDFLDADGKVVDTRYVGAEDLEPGEKAQPLAISHEPPDSQLTAKVTKAQRY